MLQFPTIEQSDIDNLDPDRYLSFHTNEERFLEASRLLDIPALKYFGQIVDVNHHDKRGDTALIIACKDRTGEPSVREQCVLLILSLGADVNAYNHSGYAAMHVSSTSTIWKLIEMGADITARYPIQNSKQKMGPSPIDTASKETRKLLLKFLNMQRSRNKFAEPMSTLELIEIVNKNPATKQNKKAIQKPKVKKENIKATKQQNKKPVKEAATESQNKDKQVAEKQMFSKTEQSHIVQQKYSSSNEERFLEAGRLLNIPALKRFGLLVDVNHRDDSGNTALINLCKGRKGKMPARIKCIMLLISLGSDVNAYNDQGYAPLHVCSIKMVRTLVKGGANITARYPIAHNNQLGPTALDVATGESRKLLLKLIEKEKNRVPNKPVQNIQKKEIAKVPKIKKENSNLSKKQKTNNKNIKTNKKQNRHLLIKTNQEGFIKAARSLDITALKHFAKIADVNYQNRAGDTALIIACQGRSEPSKRHRCIMLLLKLGVDVNAYNKKGYTALHVSSTDMVSRLIKMGADVYARYPKGDSKQLGATAFDTVNEGSRELILSLQKKELGSGTHKPKQRGKSSEQSQAKIAVKQSKKASAPTAKKKRTKENKKQNKQIVNHNATERNAMERQEAKNKLVQLACKYLNDEEIKKIVFSKYKVGKKRVNSKYFVSDYCLFYHYEKHKSEFTSRRKGLLFQTPQEYEAAAAKVVKNGGKLIPKKKQKDKELFAQHLGKDDWRFAVRLKSNALLVSFYKVSVSYIKKIASKDSLQSILRPRV